MLRRRGLIPSSPLPIFSSLFSSSSSSCCYSSCKRTLPSPPSQRPPVPKKIPFAASAHGRTWQDPYRWMSNTNDPDLLDHLNRENAYAEAFMADTRDLQRRLVADMKARMPPKLSTSLPSPFYPFVSFSLLPPLNPLLPFCPYKRRCPPPFPLHQPPFPCFKATTYLHSCSKTSLNLLVRRSLLEKQGTCKASALSISLPIFARAPLLQHGLLTSTCLPSLLSQS